MRAPCATHVQCTRTNPSVHMKMGHVRVNRGSTQPGDEKRRPRRPRFEHKCGLGVHKRRPRGTRRAWSDMPGHASLGVPRVRPCRRAESGPSPMCTPVEARHDADSAHFTTHLSRRCRCTNKPCAPHVQDSRTNPTMHRKRECVRVGRGSTQPGGEKGRPRRRKFGRKCGPGGHTRQPRGTRRVRLGMQGHKSLGVPKVHPHRRAERSAGPTCTPVERTKSALWSPLCPTPGPAAAPPVRASTPQHARM